mmetsp:Transcript_31139/g.77502  ORF Transcript_31139/g.77502 Transcript_31139/m.77502 type:complete len:300 (+) Transcript_31139:296-1195(+)
MIALGNNAMNPDPCVCNLQAGVLGQAQRQVHILHRRAAGPLAQVVQARHQPHLLLLIRREHRKLELVGVVEGVRPHKRAALQVVRLVERAHGHELHPLVPRLQARLQSLRRAPGGRQLVVVQRHRHHHALLEAAHGGAEHRLFAHPAPLRHLRQVLVLQVEPVSAPRLRAVLVDLDERLAPAGVARHGVHNEAGAGSQQPGVDERAGQRDHAGGVAPGVGDALGLHHVVALLGAQLGEPVRPAVGDAERSGRVDDDGVGVGHQRHSLDRGVVGQAQDGGVARVQHGGARHGVLTRVARE